MPQALHAASSRRAPARAITESLVFIFLGAWSIWDGFRLTAAARRRGTFDLLGPDRYIVVVGGLLILLGVLHWLAARSDSASTPAGEARQDSVFSRKLVELAAAFAGYVLLVPVGGYVLTTALFFAAVFRIMGIRSLGELAIAIACSAVAFWLAFVALADMPLPRGIWSFAF